jgi:plastocyanin
MEKRFLLGLAIGMVLIFTMSYLYRNINGAASAGPVVEQPSDIPGPAANPSLDAQETAEPQAPSSWDVMLKEESSSPDTLIINVGDSVVWTNYGANRRRFWIDEETYSDLLEPGQSYTYTFTTPGIHTFRDVFNGNVHGVVEVRESGSLITGNLLRGISSKYRWPLLAQFGVLVIGVIIVGFGFGGNKKK